MKRFIVAICIAVGIHVLILLTGPRLLLNKFPKKPKLNTITVSLIPKEMEKAISPPVKTPSPSPPKKSVIRKRKEQKKPKPRVHPPKKEKRRQRPKKARKKKPITPVIKKAERPIEKPERIEPRQNEKPAPVPHPHIETSWELEPLPSPIEYQAPETGLAHTKDNENPSTTGSTVASLDKGPAPMGKITEARPEYLKNSPPAYPLLAKRRGYQGTVILEVLVGRDGKAKEIKVFRSSGHKSLDKAAVKAVWKWVFQPATKGLKPIEAWVKIPIKFRLK